MKKIFLTLFMSLVTLCSLFAFAACRNGGENNGGDGNGEIELPDPAPIDYLKSIKGIWRLEAFSYDMIDEGDGFTAPETPFAELKITEDGTFSYFSAGASCAGTVSGTLGEKTFAFKGTAGALSVSSSARYDSERKTLTFTEIVFEGGTPEYVYRSATFRRAV